LFDLFCGSPLYVAPELIEKKNYLGPPVDIWALGVLLYAMVTGTLPFWKTGVSLQVILRKVLTGSYVIPKYLSEGKQFTNNFSFFLFFSKKKKNIC
jgi:serine/threonine protein kinase